MPISTYDSAPSALAWQEWLTPIVLAALLCGVSTIDYLFFHTLAELFAVIVAVLLFVVAWTTYRFSANHFLMFLAVGYFWVGMMDLAHTLVYKGMGILGVDEANPATQFWIATRYLEAVILLIAPFYIARPVRRTWIFVVFGAVSIAIITAVASGNFPTAYIEGVGLTTFKILSEYAIITLLIGALVYLGIYRATLDKGVFNLMAAAVVFTMIAELAFTFYVSVYGFSNLVGHIFKFFSFWLIFLAITRSSLIKPYTDLQREVTVRRTAEKALRESESRFRTVADFTYDWEHWRAPDGQFIYVSPSCERTSGYSVTQFMETPDLFERIIHPDDCERMKAVFTRANTPASNVCNSEFRIVKRDGEVRWIDYVCQSVFGNDGAYLGRRGSCRDITENKRIEDGLRQSQKAEALAVLTGGIAHDFNNILNAILSYTYLALEAVPPDHSARFSLEHVRTAGRRARDLVRQLLTFARGDEAHKEPVHLEETVAEVTALVRATIPTSIVIKQEIAEKTSRILAASTQIHQAVFNLASNAADAITPLTGTITIAVRNCALARDDKHIGPDLAEGPYVKLLVSDDGCGMDADTSLRVFDPFFTTKEVGKGTGLGLSVVHGVAASHGGALRIDSELGAGTTFTLYFPLHDDSNKAPTPQVSNDHPLGGNETILVVEDDELVAFAVQSVLEKSGYAVYMAENGLMALEIINGDKAPHLDLIITDHAMPGMTGMALARELKDAGSAYPILLFTGYMDSFSDDDARDAGVTRVLEKPVEPVGLLDIVRKVIDARIKT